MNLFLDKNKKSLFIFLITFIICFTIYPNFLFADAGDISFPDYVGFVNDFAGILDSNARSALETLISKIESETSSEIAIVTINSLEGLTIEEYAVELFEKWGIGKKDKNNGVLILASMEERAVRIEVGYGLEAVITDLEAGDIIDDIIVPDFKNGNYSTGLYNAVVAISNEIYEEEGLEPIVQEEDLKATKSTTAYSSSTGSRFLQGSFWLLFCCFPIPLFIGLITRRAEFHALQCVGEW